MRLRIQLAITPFGAIQFFWRAILVMQIYIKILDFYVSLQFDKSKFFEGIDPSLFIGPGDRMLQFSVCSFDIFVEEVFTTLLSGATLVIPSEEAQKDVKKLLAFCTENGITIISGFPYLLAEMNKKPQMLPESLPASARCVT